jgi:hypothetical protein
LTGTLAAHAVKPSPTLTTPLATRCFFRLSVTLLGWTVLTTKSAVLATVPPPTVTLILPVVAPVGTVAVICVAEFTVKLVAATLLKLTAVAPVKPVPVIVTTVPTGPDVGVKDVIVAQVAATVKSVELVAAVPTPVSTLIFPVVAPEGTDAMIWVALATEAARAAVVLNVTAPALSEASRRFVPVMLTEVPTGPHVGVNEVMVGAQVPGLVTVKFVLLVPTPGSALSTVIAPVVPAATSARICVAETIVKFAAGVPPNSTAVTTGLSKFVPVMVTTQPVGPLVGVNDVIVGGTANAGASRPSTSKAAATPTAATRRPMCRLKRVMAPFSLSSSTSSRIPRNFTLRV